MDKYGVLAESVVCTKCDGTGKTVLGKKQYVLCTQCDGTGREKNVDPIKEAEEIKKQIEEKDEG